MLYLSFLMEKGGICYIHFTLNINLRSNDKALNPYEVFASDEALTPLAIPFIIQMQKG